MKEKEKAVNKKLRRNKKDRGRLILRKTKIEKEINELEPRTKKPIPAPRTKKQKPIPAPRTFIKQTEKALKATQNLMKLKLEMK